MSLRIAPIVEGHGDVDAVRLLLPRIWSTFADPASYPTILKPFRVSKDKIIRDETELLRAVDFVELKLRPDRGLVLLIIDADAHAACHLGPRLLQSVAAARPHIDFACVIAVVEFETWFVAAATSLATFFKEGFEPAVPSDPERDRCGKGWIQEFFRAGRYSETADQPRLAARLDLHLARSRSPSFDKLCREIEKRRF